MRSSTADPGGPVAAGLSVLVAIIGVVLFDVPSLMLGAEDSAAPFLLMYGAWRGRKWGAVLLIVVDAFWIVQAVSSLLVDTAAPALVFAAPEPQRPPARLRPARRRVRGCRVGAPGATGRPRVRGRAAGP